MPFCSTEITCTRRFNRLASPACRAVSSAVEHLLHTQGVAGSNPAPRTTPLSPPRPPFHRMFVPVRRRFF